MILDSLFNNLPLHAVIIIWSIIGIFGLWFFIFILSLSFSIVFKKKIKNTSSTINMLMNQRYDVVISLMNILKKYNIQISDLDKKAISNLERVHDFQALSKDDRDNRVLTFVHSSHNILSFCESSNEVVNDEEYAKKLLIFNDTEETYRQKSALYNSDIIGYNYWVNVRVCKHLLKLFGLKTKDLIV